MTTLIWIVIGIASVGAIGAIFVAVLDEICRYGSRSKTSKIYARRERTGFTVYPRKIT